MRAALEGEPDQLAILMLAVALLTLQGAIINRLAGIRYPMWSSPSPGSRSPDSPTPSVGEAQVAGTPDPRIRHELVSHPAPAARHQFGYGCSTSSCSRARASFA